MKIVRFCLLMLIFFSVFSVAYSQDEEGSPVEKLQQQTDLVAAAVEKLSKVKLTGYIQSQWQWTDKEGSLNIGNARTSAEEATPFNRFGIRRGRVKIAYEESFGLAVFQLDMTEKGVGIKDAYLLVKEPLLNSFALKAGLFDRPFGYEISYSSSRRESPERSRVTTTLFPDERDLGAMLVIQAPKGHALNFLKLEAGLFGGNGVRQDTDSHKDFIGHLTASKTTDKLKLGLGLSHYNGDLFAENLIYEMKGSTFSEVSRDENTYWAKRTYTGIDAQVMFESELGMTQLRGEWLAGTQPGTDKSTKSPNASILPSGATYMRNFQGAYLYFVQDILHTKHSFVAKYDYYDPNKDVKKREIGVAGSKTGAADIAYTTIGLGWLYRFNASVRLMAYYDFVSNETSDNLSGYEKERKDNLFTLRLQYKF
ncbi:MAG: hypothetical protein AB7C90_01240 [Bacteroidales bacterium]